MIKKLMFCFFTLMAGISTIAQVRPTLSFVNYLSDDATKSSVSSALDGNSKVYTAGRVLNTTEDIIVQCTDSTGVVLWSYLYDNGGYDSPNKIKVDAAGYTYVTGISAGAASTLNDYITLKIDPSGTLVWAHRYDRGVAGGYDEGLDLCVDQTSNVFVTGKSKNAAGDFDAVTIKIDGSSGTTMWQHVSDQSGFDDIGVCLTLADSQNYLVIASTSFNSGGNSDIVTYQIDVAGGTQNWNYGISGNAGGNDYVSSIILAGSNVVLTGVLDQAGTGKDYVTAKFDAVSGTNIWTNTYDFSTDDAATSLVRDSTGNIAVTGLAFNPTTSKYEYHTVLYDSLGGSAWVHKKILNCSSTNVIPVIVCDTIAHHFYISGEIEKISRDILIYQLTPTGNLGWEKTFDRPSIYGTDFATSLVVNGIGVLFISANTTNGSSNYDLTTLKIAQTPVYFPPDLGTQELKDDNFVFEKNHGQLLKPNGSSVDPLEVGYYNQGYNPSYYFNNSHIGYVLTDKDTILDTIVRVNLNILGANSHADVYHYNPIDAKKHYFTASSLGITDVTSYERLFIPEIYPNVDLHHYSNSKGLKSYFVFKAQGETMGALRLQVAGADSTAIVGGYLIAYTNLGNINMGKVTAYQAGYNPITNSLIQTPLTASWNSLGSNNYNFSVSGYLPVLPIVVYVSRPGATSATSAGPNGNMYWSTFVGGQGTDNFQRTKTDAKDNLYVGGNTTTISYPTIPGSFFPTPPSSAAGVQWGTFSKFRQDGKLIYSTYYGGSGSGCSPAFTQVKGIAIDSLYNIYMVGTTNASNLVTKTITVSGSLNYQTNPNTLTNCQTAFIAKINLTGNILRYATYFGGTDSEGLNCVSYKNGQIFMAGYSSSTSIPLVTPQPNTYQISSGRGMYLHMDTACSMKHNTKLQQTIYDGDVDKNANYYMVSNVITGIGGGALPLRAPASTFYTANLAGAWDWGIQRMSQADSLTWSTNFGGSSSDFVSNICIRDSIMAICGYGTSSNFPFVKSATDSGDVVPYFQFDIQLAKFDIRTGQRIWCALHATGNIETPYGIALDKNYNLYVSGMTECPSGNTVTPVCSLNGFKNLPAGSYYQQSYKIDHDAFLLAYNNKNQRRWTTYFGSLSATTGQPNYDAGFGGLAVNNNNKLFMAGYTDCTNNTLPLSRWNSSCYYDSLYAGGGDGFITMFDVTTFSLVGINENNITSKNADILLFPNPNSGIFNIRFSEPSTDKINVTIVNAMGQIVYEKMNAKVEQSNLTLEVGNLAPGIYLIQVNDLQKKRTVKMIKN